MIVINNVVVNVVDSMLTVYILPDGRSIVKKYKKKELYNWHKVVSVINDEYHLIIV